MHVVLQQPAKKDVENFEKVVIEAPVIDIFERLRDNPSMRKEFNFSDLQFSINQRKLKQQSETDTTGGEEDPGEGASDRVQKRPRRTGLNKRFATEQKVDTSSINPNGWGMLIYPGGERIAFIYDYKAAYKLTMEDLKPALAKEKLFMEVIDRICSNKVSKDDKLCE